MKHSKCKLTFLDSFRAACLSEKFKSPVHFSNAISIICHLPKFSSILSFVLQLDANNSVGVFFFHTESETPSVVESVHISFHLCLEPRNGCVAAFREAQTMLDRHREKLRESQPG